MGTGCHVTREDDVAFLCCCIQQELNYNTVLNLWCVNFIDLSNLLLEQTLGSFSVPNLVGYKLKMGTAPPWLVNIQEH